MRSTPRRPLRRSFLVVPAPLDVNGSQLAILDRIVFPITQDQLVVALQTSVFPKLQEYWRVRLAEFWRSVCHLTRIHPAIRYQGHQCSCAAIAGGLQLQIACTSIHEGSSFNTVVTRMTRDTIFFPGPYSTTAALRSLERKMIFLSPVEHKLLEYSISPDADLSRDAIADAAGIIPVSVGRILTRLRDRGLIEIQRGPHRRIVKIEPTFPYELGKTFKTMNPQQRRFWQ